MFPSKISELNLKTQNDEIRIRAEGGKKISYCQSVLGLV